MSASGAATASDAAARERRLPLTSLAFDSAVALAGAAVAVWAFFAWIESGHASPALLGAVPLIALLAHYPLVLLRREGDIEIGFDSAVLVLLALTTSTSQALAIWTIGVVAAQLTSKRRWRARGFNVGLGAACGGVAVAVMRAIAPLNETRPRELLAVALGCAVYFVADFVLTDVSIAVECRSAPLSSWRDPNVRLSFAVFVGIDALGYVGALLLRLVPWALPLLAAPIVTILFAARAFARANKNETLMSGLYDAALRTQWTTSPEDLLALLADQVRRVLRSPDAGFRNRAAFGGEIGVRVDDAAGREQWLVVPPRISGAPYNGEDRRTLETLAALAGDALARARLVGEMAHMARHDTLTGLPNRALFQDRVEHAVDRQHRDGQPLAVLFIDLDGFKAVNDRLGHAAGDALLRSVAERLMHCVRPGDTVARLGGDEFAVLLEDLADPHGAEEISRRMVQALARPVDVTGTRFVVGASIGIALRAAGESAAALLRNSDIAMYRAKQLGKGRYQVFEPSMRDESLQRLALESDLRQVVDKDELRVCYQPIVDLHGGAVEGFEALLRWEHPVHGTIDPTRFVSVAEEIGLIVPIGAWVLDRAYRDAAAWSRAHGRRMSLGVNVSGPQLVGPALVDQVRRLQASTAPADVQLVLEITESMLVRDDPETAATLRELRALGVQVAIDDFGTGYSSISYLRHLPIDILKIDRSFVAEVAADTRAAALVAAITAMGRSLSLKLVAEGIETVDQAIALRGLGCRHGQGFWFGRPMSAGEAEAFFAGGRVDVAAEVAPLPRGALQILAQRGPA